MELEEFKGWTDTAEPLKVNSVLRAKLISCFVKSNSQLSITAPETLRCELLWLLRASFFPSQGAPALQTQMLPSGKGWP